MLDLRFIRENPDRIKKNTAERRVEVDVDRLVALAEQRAKLTTDIQEMQRQQNDAAKQIKQAKSQAEREPFIKAGKELRERVAAAEEEQRQLDAAVHELQLQIPNVTHPAAPQGPGAHDVVVREVGQRPSFAFKPLDHVALCEQHDLADFEAAAKVTGSSFYYLKNEGALLELALVNHAIQRTIAAGFTPVFTPDLARAKIVEGTGYLPRGPETQIYSIANSDLCLIATAEITLAGMFADEILDAARLPIRLVGLSHCFRTEAGAAGKATRGLFRVHQFTKVEMFAFTLPEQSDAMHEELLALEESIFQDLEVPYRVLDIGASDLGGPAYRKYDVEAWMPGRGENGEYGEVTSTSNCTDYQARRLGIRYKTAGEKGTRFVHMLNGTAVATGRAIVAILENHQQADGTIRVPKVLVPFVGKERIG